MTRRLVLALITLTATACAAPTGTEMPTSWPAEVKPVNLDGSVQGDLAAGKTVGLDWANTSNMGCWITTENPNFTGHHVFYAVALPANTTLKVTVEPAAGVDVSLYGILEATTQFEVPPQTRTAAQCKAGYDAVNDNNPGAPETITLTSAGTPYNALIGVAGAKGLTAGAYTLKLESRK